MSPSATGKPAPAVGQRLDAPRDGSNLGDELRAYMAEHGLTQTDLAKKLTVERLLVSHWLAGRRTIREVSRLRDVADRLGIAPERFGLMPEPGSASAGVPVLDRQVIESADAWRLVRRSLNARRAELTKHAASLYNVARVEGTSLLTTESWMLDEPADLSTVELSWVESTPEPALTGREPESESCRPLMPSGKPYARYSHAIYAVERPSLFVNRPSYRLLDVAWDAGKGHQTYGFTTYFDMVDVCEAASHELAAAGLSRNGHLERVDLSNLPFRALVGDRWIFNVDLSFQASIR